jgi:hypothetical protein
MAHVSDLKSATLHANAFPYCLLNFRTISTASEVPFASFLLKLSQDWPTTDTGQWWARERQCQH